uniref:Flavin-containing monooxygenase n=1 Tax=Saccoglossus kowalevskii TaxID=10224 RepID=A0ABM0M3E9_SACKO|nr:PREDICTED: dimethylaniline monooxygenase [N-oxide-forming] 2-like [Saccoglossus kowalevskii]
MTVDVLIGYLFSGLDCLYGGIWYYSDELRQGQMAASYDSLVTNFSKEMLSFSDFPFPKEWPPFIPHKRVHQYLHSYAEHYDLKKYIRFNQDVLSIEQSGDGRWNVFSTNNDGKLQETFDHLMVCTGVFNKIHYPSYPGLNKFAGIQMHANKYRNTTGLTNKRIVVVGAGSSAGDIACELARSGSTQVYLSMRNGTWVIPRTGPDSYPYDMRTFSKSAMNGSTQTVASTLDKLVRQNIQDYKRLGWGNLLHNSFRWTKRYPIGAISDSDPNSWDETRSPRPDPKAPSPDPGTTNFCFASRVKGDGRVPWSFSSTHSETIQHALRAKLRPINVLEFVGATLERILVRAQDSETSDAERTRLLEQVTQLMVGHRMAMCDILQCHMALLAGATTVQRDTVLDACVFAGELSQGVRHHLSYADWTNQMVQVESASQLAAAKGKLRAPQAQKAQRSRTSSTKQSRPGGKHSYPSAGGKCSGAPPGKRGPGGGSSSSSSGGHHPRQRDGDDMKLYKYVFLVRMENPEKLAVIGMIAPFSTVWPCMELQARWATRVFTKKLNLPKKEEMLADIETKPKYSRRYCLINPYVYEDEIAECIGVKPSFWKLLLSDPKLAMAVQYGPQLSYMYRLQGPGKWDGARDAILNARDNTVSHMASYRS